MHALIPINFSLNNSASITQPRVNSYLILNEIDVSVAVEESLTEFVALYFIFVVLVYFSDTPTFYAIPCQTYLFLVNQEFTTLLWFFLTVFTV